MVRTRDIRGGKLGRVTLVVAALVGTGLGLPGCANEEPVVETTATDPRADIIRMPVSADQPVDTANMPRIRFAESDFDFGEVAEGGLVRHRFPFVNAGSRPLVITNARSTCGCTVPQYPEAPVAAGDTASILVEFNTAGKSGRQDKPVTLTANTYPSETTIRISGAVEAPSD